MKHKIESVSAAGLLISLGIIFGDIGTSPLYVMKAIAGEREITEVLILGGLSCVFWTLTLQTSLKYVTLTLEADNRGEGGMFALYALVRRKGRWLIFPAMIGGSALLADGIITPPISVSSAIEGLRIYDPDIPTIPIVITILIALFAVQSFGTSKVGRGFGPIMLVWFSMLAVTGASQIWQRPDILRAANPYYAWNLLTDYPDGFLLLGAVFLATTGAEALYSDLGHCGKCNIRISWCFVKTCLLTNYAGQSAWLLTQDGQTLAGRNPFYSIIPEQLLFPSIVIATMAAIIASQALISGSFTLVNEAMRLYLLPKFKVVYPTEIKGQLYVPLLNTLLLGGCVGVVLFFEESANMEAAYGLSITVTMLMTTLLLVYYLAMRGVRFVLICLFLTIYLPIELTFLAANLDKFAHGGWVTFIIGGFLVTCMWVWHSGSLLKRRYTEYEDIAPRLPILTSLSEDHSVPKFATHIVYLTGAPLSNRIEKKIVYSMLQKQPKRADVYWFLHVDVTDDPYGLEYTVDTLVPERVFRVNFMLGFRIEPRINRLFRVVVEEMAGNGEVDIFSRYESLRRAQVPGDFRFVVLRRHLSPENDLPPREQLVMKGYSLLKRLSLSEEKSFGLDTSSVVSEEVPLIIGTAKPLELVRVDRLQPQPIS